MPPVNLGNVVGLIKSATPPTKTYIIWAKQLDPLGNPDIIELMRHDGTDWVPLGGISSSVVVDQDLPLHILGDINGKPDYTVPIDDEIVLRHQGIYRRDVSEGINMDLGDGQGSRDLDVEVISFSGIVYVGQLFGTDWNANAVVSYSRTVITDPNTSDVQSLSNSINVIQESLQFHKIYNFMKTDVDGKIHRALFASTDVFTTTSEVMGGWVDNAGNYTDTTPTIGGGSGIPEAPQDGNKYVRKDAAWVNTDNYFKYLVVDGAQTFSTSVIDIDASFVIHVGSYFNGDDATTTDYSSHFTLKSSTDVPITISVVKSGTENYVITVDKSSLYSVFPAGGFNQLILTADGSADGGQLLYDVLLAEINTSPMELVKCYNIQEGRMRYENDLFILTFPKVTLAEIGSNSYEVGAFTDLTIKPATQDCVISSYVTRVSTPYLTVFPPINLKVSLPANTFSKEIELRSQIDTGSVYQTIIKHFIVFFKVKEVN
ncbi:MAG: hypothetical protein EKK63_12695 [Acinetobacter sp.]|uniref:hypothetical protein n=1 Tax=Acinetobacter sp. TaxID=472 RepID=UPI000F9F3BF2|nr:hypothetical protein [Acinetobacter sp.]RUP38232.1 MAG: hypothetical protein EKK63_12695 [Acinetobacter sp.]